MSNILLSAEQVSKVRVLEKKPKTVLDCVNMHINRGEIVGLLGVNGAGKTTLVSIIASVLAPTSGDVLYNGASIYTNLIGYRLKLGYCPQQPNFENNLSVRENLIFAGRYYGMEPDKIQTCAEQLIHTFELTDYADTSPGNLSGGYQRRLLLARTLIHSPELILLDEPTIGLDPHVRRELLQAIRQLKTDKVSVMITTHYLDEIEKLVDRVYIIDKGRIVAGGTIDELNQQFGTATLEELFFATTNKPIKSTETL